MNRSRNPIKIISLGLILSLIFEQAGWAAYGLEGPVVSASAGSMAVLVRDPSKLEVPQAHASVEEFHAGSNGRLVLHIQDPHSNFEGQKNLSVLVGSLSQRYGVSLVLSEGGDGDSSLMRLRESLSTSSRKRLALKWLREARISGEEYWNLTGDQPLSIEGMENFEQYWEGVSAYADLAARREKALAYLARIRRAVDSLKARLYSPELLAYERASADESKAVERLQLLVSGARSAGLTELPRELSRWAALRERESVIDYAAAHLERVQLIEASGMDPASPLPFLLRSARGRYPELEKIARVTEQARALDAERLLIEAETLERVWYQARLRGRAARLLRSIDRYTRLLEKAFSIRMTSGEYAEFEASEKNFATFNSLAFLNRQLAEYGRAGDWVPYRDVLEEGKAALRRFYRSVDERDRTFVARLGQALEQHGQSGAFLVAGGYHTRHLKKLLTDQGYSWAVLRPVVTAETNLERYETRLLSPLGRPSFSRLSLRDDPARQQVRAPLLQLVLSRPQYFDDARRVTQELAAEGVRLALRKEDSREVKMSAPETPALRIQDALIIGAGPAGLMVGAALQTYGLSFSLLEKGRSGETWHKLPERVIASFRPADFWGWLDRHPDDEKVSLKGRKAIIGFLEKYIEEFGLGGHIVNQEAVEGVKMIQAFAGTKRSWPFFHEVISREAATSLAHLRYAWNTIVATGVFHTPRRLTVEGAEKWGRRVIRIDEESDIDEVDPEAFRGEHVLIVGGGNTAFRIVGFVKDYARKITMVTSSPRLFFWDETQNYAHLDPSYRPMIQELEKRKAGEDSFLSIILGWRVRRLTRDHAHLHANALNGSDDSVVRIGWDRAVIATGYSPNLDFMAAQGIGITDGKPSMNRYTFQAKDAEGREIPGRYLMGVEPMTGGGVDINGGWMMSQASVISSSILSRKILSDRSAQGARLAGDSDPRPELSSRLRMASDPGGNMKGDEFRLRRQALGLTQSDAAPLFDVSQPTIWHWESRNGPVPDEAHRRMVDLFSERSAATLADIRRQMDLDPDDFVRVVAAGQTGVEILDMENGRSPVEASFLQSAQAALKRHLQDQASLRPQRLSSIREAAGLSMSEFGRALRPQSPLSASYVYLLENGLQNVPLDLFSAAEELVSRRMNLLLSALGPDPAHALGRERVFTEPATPENLKRLREYYEQVSPGLLRQIRAQQRLSQSVFGAQLRRPLTQLEVSRRETGIQPVEPELLIDLRAQAQAGPRPSEGAAQSSMDLKLFNPGALDAPSFTAMSASERRALVQLAQSAGGKWTGDYGNALVALVDGRTAGYQAFSSEGRLIHDEGLYVVPSFRRQQVAMRLRQAFIDWARSAGFTEFREEVESTEQAQRFHRSWLETLPPGAARVQPSSGLIESVAVRLEPWKNGARLAGRKRQPDEGEQAIAEEIWLGRTSPISVPLKQVEAEMAKGSARFIVDDESSIPSAGRRASEPDQIFMQDTLGGWWLHTHLRDLDYEGSTANNYGYLNGLLTSVEQVDGRWRAAGATLVERYPFIKYSRQMEWVRPAGPIPSVETRQRAFFDDRRDAFEAFVQQVDAGRAAPAYRVLRPSETGREGIFQVEPHVQSVRASSGARLGQGLPPAAQAALRVFVEAQLQGAFARLLEHEVRQRAAQSPSTTSFALDQLLLYGWIESDPDPNPGKPGPKHVHYWLSWPARKWVDRERNNLTALLQSSGFNVPHLIAPRSGRFETPAPGNEFMEQVPEYGKLRLGRHKTLVSLGKAFAGQWIRVRDYDSGAFELWDTRDRLVARSSNGREYERRLEIRTARGDYGMVRMTYADPSGRSRVVEYTLGAEFSGNPIFVSPLDGESWSSGFRYEDESSRLVAVYDPQKGFQRVKSGGEGARMADGFASGDVRGRLETIREALDQGRMEEAATLAHRTLMALDKIPDPGDPADIHQMLEEFRQRGFFDFDLEVVRRILEVPPMQTDVRSFLSALQRGQSESLLMPQLPFKTLETQGAYRVPVTDIQGPESEFEGRPRIGSGVFVSAYDNGDGVVYKRRRPWLGGVLPVEESFQLQMNQTTLEGLARLKADGFPVPQAWPVDGLADFNQRKAIGHRVSDLYERRGRTIGLQRSVEDSYAQLIGEARDAYPRGFFFDPGYWNATYSDPIAVIDWFDPITPVGSAFIAEVRRRINILDYLADELDWANDLGEDGDTGLGARLATDVQQLRRVPRGGYLSIDGVMRYLGTAYEGQAVEVQKTPGGYRVMDPAGRMIAVLDVNGYRRIETEARRLTNRHGQFEYDSRRYNLTRQFAGREVTIRPIEGARENGFEVYSGGRRIGYWDRRLPQSEFVATQTRAVREGGVFLFAGSLYRVVSRPGFWAGQQIRLEPRESRYQAGFDGFIQDRPVAFERYEIRRRPKRQPVGPGVHRSGEGARLSSVIEPAQQQALERAYLDARQHVRELRAALNAVEVRANSQDYVSSYKQEADEAERRLRAAEESLRRLVDGFPTGFQLPLDFDEQGEVPSGARLAKESLGPQDAQTLNPNALRTVARAYIENPRVFREGFVPVELAGQSAAVRVRPDLGRKGGARLAVYAREGGRMIPRARFNLSSAYLQSLRNTRAATRTDRVASLSAQRQESPQGPEAAVELFKASEARFRLAVRAYAAGRPVLVRVAIDRDRWHPALTASVLAQIQRAKRFLADRKDAHVRVQIVSVGGAVYEDLSDPLADFGPFETVYVAAASDTMLSAARGLAFLAVEDPLIAQEAAQWNAVPYAASVIAAVMLGRAERRADNEKLDQLLANLIGVHYAAGDRDAAFADLRRVNAAGLRRYLDLSVRAIGKVGLEQMFEFTRRVLRAVGSSA